MLKTGNGSGPPSGGNIRRMSLNDYDGSTATNDLQSWQGPIPRFIIYALTEGGEDTDRLVAVVLVVTGAEDVNSFKI